MKNDVTKQMLPITNLWCAKSENIYLLLPVWVRVWVCVCMCVCGWATAHPIDNTPLPVFSNFIFRIKRQCFGSNIIISEPIVTCCLVVPMKMAFAIVYRRPSLPSLFRHKCLHRSFAIHPTHTHPPSAIQQHRPTISLIIFTLCNFMAMLFGCFYRRRRCLFWF